MGSLPLLPLLLLMRQRPPRLLLPISGRRQSPGKGIEGVAAFITAAIGIVLSLSSPPHQTATAPISTRRRGRGERWRRRGRKSIGVIIYSPLRRQRGIAAAAAAAAGRGVMS